MSAASRKAFRRQRRVAWEKQGRKCIYCDKPMTEGQVTADHIIPRSNGGKGLRDNIAAACRKCNSRKGNRTGVEYLMLRYTQQPDATY